MTQATDSAGDKLNVLITYRWQRLSDALVERIGSVSPRLNVIYAENEQEDVELLSSTDILYSIWLPKTLDNAPRLKWIQLLSAGYNTLFGSEVETSSITVTTSSGIHGVPISEFVLASMVILSRRLLETLDMTAQMKAGAADQAIHHETLWRPFTFLGRELYGQTVGIVGIGGIGREIVRLARAFGMRVIGIDPHADTWWTTPDDRYAPDALRTVPLQNDLNVEIRPTTDLDWLLRESDFVVLTLPVTPETTHLIGERELRLMKQSAHLINPARGALIDETALLRALDEGWIAGAALDVFDVEPLPADHPFFQRTNVLATPHMSAHTDRLWERCVDVFCANLRRYLAGEPLLNQVHPRPVLIASERREGTA